MSARPPLAPDDRTTLLAGEELVKRLPDAADRAVLCAVLKRLRELSRDYAARHGVDLELPLENRS